MNFSEALEKGINSCAKPYYKHKRRLEREQRAERDFTCYYRPHVKTLKDYLFEIFPEAYEIASGGGKFTPMVRQLYYVVRRLLQEKGCDKDLEDAYHRKTLEDYEKAIGKRLCFRKPVGEMLEPHSQCPTCGTLTGCALGTQEVYSYKVPRNRFNKILYVEKAGFMSQLLQENIHNKYDIAIAAGAGFATQAAKELLAKIEKDVPVKIYCLHDADMAGVEIARSLGDRLVHENYFVSVIDLGLSPGEAIDLNLPSEKVYITSEPSQKLKERVTDEELQWLLGEDCRGDRHWNRRGRMVRYYGNRVELNAFTPEEFIEWVEEKLQALDLQKVIPDAGVLSEFANESRVSTITRMVTEILLQRDEIKNIIKDAASKSEHTISPEEVQGLLDDDPESNWQKVIEERVASETVELAIESLDIKCGFVKKQPEQKKKVAKTASPRRKNKSGQGIDKRHSRDKRKNDFPDDSIKDRSRAFAEKATRAMMNGNDARLMSDFHKIIKDFYGMLESNSKKSTQKEDK